MKNVLILLLLVSFGTYAQSIYPTGVAGCIARYTFDSNDGGNVLNPLTDVSGNNHNGSSTDLLPANGWKNISNTAGSFNGFSSFSEVTHTNLLNPNNITMVALVKPNAFNTNTCQANTIVHKGFDHGASSTSNSWSMFISDNDNDCYFYNANKHNMGYAIKTLQSYPINNNNFVNAGKWYFMAVTYDGLSAKFYQNEMDANSFNSNIQPFRTISSSTGLGNSTDNFLIGASLNPSFKYWFDGLMDEVVIFNSALSQTNIQGVYNYLWGASGALGSAVTENKASFSFFLNNKKLKVTGDNFNPKQIIVTDINGRVLINKINIDEVNENLQHIPNQLIFIKVISQNGTVHNQKMNLSW